MSVDINVCLVVPLGVLILMLNMDNKQIEAAIMGAAASIIAVDFNMQVSTYSMLLTGAMENKSLNIFNSKLVLVSPETAIDADYAAILGVIGHEYFNSLKDDPEAISDMMSNISAEDLQNMFQMASSLKGKDSNGLGSDTKSKPAKDWETFAVRGDHAGESSSSHGSFSNSKTTPQSSFLNPTADVQEQMKSQMKHPALWQVFDLCTLAFMPALLYIRCVWTPHVTEIIWLHSISIKLK
ncbi:Puromycin-sensitive aminopeptidase [Camellia lanceoleosa]|uniref:Puromycin-sensitive aminopeptidase n=1 Tax=Camellia lanceoleosa TaxID=1840588 RepID=A0ACC0GPU7_9ERIC|nr:Puromycin-sensitive aminopeptidase [Camellia lanceoleosa]